MSMVKGRAGGRVIDYGDGDYSVLSDGDDQSVCSGDVAVVVPSHLRHLQVQIAPPCEQMVEVADRVYLDRSASMYQHWSDTSLGAVSVA